jgi:hypothetical protein
MKASEMKKMKKSISSLNMTLLALFCLPAVLFGYSLLDYNWAWQTDPMEEVFLVNPNCADASAGSPEIQIFSIVKGADAWTNDGNAKFKFRYGGVTDKTGGGWRPDGYNVVFFKPEDGGDVIATTYSHSDGSDMIEFDIAFWDAGWIFYGGIEQPPLDTDFDIWGITAHEMGHALGLDHTWQFQATMYPYANYREVRARDIWDDDIAGIQAIYGVPNVRVTMTPDDSLTLIPSTGGSLGYSVEIANNTGSAKTRTFWIDVVLPSGATYGPVNGPVTATVPAWANWNFAGFVQDVPAFAPAGLYCYVLKSSTAFHGTVENMTTFPFIKEAALAGSTGQERMPAWGDSGLSRIAEW